MTRRGVRPGRSAPCGVTPRHARSTLPRPRTAVILQGGSTCRPCRTVRTRTPCLRPGGFTMRRIALPLLLALSSLAFAPAPLPRQDRRTEQRRQWEVAALTRRLDELRVVRWVIDGPDGRPMLRFNRDHPDGRGGTGG